MNRGGMLRRIALATACAVASATVAESPVASANAQDGDAREVRTFLKHDVGTDTWWRIERLLSGEILSHLPAAAPDLSPPAAYTGPVPIFQPFVAHAVGSWPEAVAIGDLNGDGLDDVALVTSSYFDPANDHSLHVFRQNGSGGFHPRTVHFVGANPTTVDVGDLNDDGRIDVIVGRNGSGLAVFLQDAAGTLQGPVSYAAPRSHKVRIGDFDHDSRNDVVAIAWGAQSQAVDVFRQDAGGSLALAQTLNGLHGGYDDLEVGDINGDLRQDAVVMSGQLYATPNLALFRQQAAGLLAPAVALDLGGNELTHGIGIGHLDGDLLHDIAASYGGNSPSSKMAVWRQQPGGTFGSAQILSSYDIPEPVEVSDVTADGLADVVVAHGGWVRLGVYRQAAGALSAEELYVIPYASSYDPHGLAVGDVNGDGAKDVVIADYNNGLVVLYQYAPASPPARPRWHSVRALAGRVVLAWADTARAARYRVLRSTQPAGPYSQITQTTARMVVDRSVVAGTTYYYLLAAANSLGEALSKGVAANVP